MLDCALVTTSAWSYASHQDFRWFSVVQVEFDCLGVTGEDSAIQQSARRQMMPDRTEESDMVVVYHYRANERMI